jgi:hypothetical protein
LLFSALFFIYRKSISNGVQTQRNFLENFFGPKDIQRAEEVSERGPEVGTTHLGTPGPPGMPSCLVLPLGLLSGTSLAHWMSSGPKKSPKSFTAFGLRLIWIFCETKTGQKIASGTWHYVNRLVPKNDVSCYKIIVKHPRLIIYQHGTIKNYRYIGDVSASPSLIPARPRVGK